MQAAAMQVKALQAKVGQQAAGQAGLGAAGLPSSGLGHAGISMHASMHPSMHPSSLHGGSSMHTTTPMAGGGIGMPPARSHSAPHPSVPASSMAAGGGAAMALLGVPSMSTMAPAFFPLGGQAWGGGEAWGSALPPPPQAMSQQGAAQTPGCQGAADHQGPWVAEQQPMWAATAPSLGVEPLPQRTKSASSGGYSLF